MSNSSHVQKLASRSTIAGSSHVPYALKHNPEHADAVATQIAKRYITLFDEALRARGYVVAAAVEVEADIRIGRSERKRAKIYNPEAKDYKAAQHIAEYMKRGTRAMVKDVQKTFPSARGSIEKCIKETGLHDVEFTTVPAKPIQAALRAAHIKQNLFEGSLEGFKQLTGVSLKGLDSEQRAKVIEENSAALSKVAKESLHHRAFSSVRFQGRASWLHPLLDHGEHINISVHDVKDASRAKITNEMMASSHLMSDDRFTRGFCRFMTNYGFNDWALLDTGPDSTARMQWRYSTVGHLPVVQVEYLEGGVHPVYGIRPHRNSAMSYMRVQGEEPELRRIELRVPDAQCNSYLAMMYTMAHLYAYINEYEKNPSMAEQGLSSLGVAPCMPHEFFHQTLEGDGPGASIRFRNESMVVRMMEAVGQQLHVNTAEDRQRFKGAILKRRRSFQTDQIESGYGAVNGR